MSRGDAAHRLRRAWDGPPVVGPSDPYEPDAADAPDAGGTPSRGSGPGPGAGPALASLAGSVLSVPLPLAVGLVAVAMGAGGWWLFAGRADPGTTLLTPSSMTTAATVVAGAAPGRDPTPPPSGGAAAAVTTAVTTGPASVTLHVAGAVASAGVVVVPGGSRVVDAVAAAGGADPVADLSAVNLARPVVDGEMVVVPTPGQQVPPVAGPGAAGAGEPADRRIDLNTATAAEFEGLPGIGPVLSERIVAWREDTGPFGSVEDLSAVPGIGEALMAQVRDLVEVRST